MKTKKQAQEVKEYRGLAQALENIIETLAKENEAKYKESFKK